MAITAGQPIRADDFINNAGKNATPSNDAGRVAKLEANGQISQTFIFNHFGNGADGDVTISSPTTLTRDMYYNNLTVNSTLTTNGFIIHVKETLSGNGTIKYPTPNAGGNGSSSTGGAGGNGFSGSTYGRLLNVPGSGGGAGGNSNGSGTVGPAGTGGVGTARAGNLSATPSRQGGQGGQGADYLIGGPNNNNTGGYGGRHEYADSGSGAKAGGGGGGGGASGGIILIFAKIWAGTFTIQAVGGTGGNGGNGSSGGAKSASVSTEYDRPTGGVAGAKVNVQSFGNDFSLDSKFLHLWPNNTFTIYWPCGAGGGGGGNARTYIPAGGGGGGNGGMGGISVVFYKVKTWSGSYDLAGGAGGNGGLKGTGGGGGCEDGGNGTAGATGAYYEIDCKDVIN